MSNLEYLCHSHFYIISKVTGAALAVDRYGSEDGGMKPNITINQYNAFDGEKQYNEAFKFSFQALGAMVFEITSKRTGLSIAVKGDKVDHDKQPIVQTQSPQSISTVAQKSGISFAAAESWLTKPYLTRALLHGSAYV